MKKLLAVLLAALMVFSMLAFTACTKTETVDEEKTEAPTADETASAEGEEENQEEPNVVEVVEDDLQYIVNKGTLVIGITDFEPMDYQDADGSWIGFDADMAVAFAEYLGVIPEFQIIDWDNKVMELNSKIVDVIWNGMTLTDEVKASMETSNAYCNNAQVVILPASVADNYSDAESLKDLTFAVESGSAGKEMAEEYGFNYIEVADQATTLLEVKSGTADASIIDSLMAAAMVGEGTSYADLTYTIGLNSEEYGVGFRKGSTAAYALNDFLKASYADGTMEEIAETYGVQAAIIAQ